MSDNNSEKTSSLASMLRWTSMSVFLGSVLMGMTRRAYAANFYVTNTNDTGAGSLRQAVIDANNRPGADDIYFDTAGAFYYGGRITLSSEIVITGDVTIHGTGSQYIYIRGGNSTRLFKQYNANGTSVIEGVTLQDGYANSAGGAVLNASGTLELRSSVVTSSSSPKGGGIANVASNATLKLTNNTSVYDNYAFPAGSSALGGGIYNKGTLELTNSTVSGNSARSDSDYEGRGGGIYSVAGTLKITNSIVSNNYASSSRYNGAIGGGIAISGAGSLQMTGGNVSYNRAFGSYYSNATQGAYGGGIWINGANSQLELTSARIDHNYAFGGYYSGGGQGGGVCHFGANATTTLADSSISQNIAFGSYASGVNTGAGGLGGGLCVYGNKHKTIIDHTTFDSNLAGGSNSTNGGIGGGIYVRGRQNSLKIIDSTISNNTAGSSNIGAGFYDSGRGGGIAFYGRNHATFEFAASDLTGNVAEGVQHGTALGGGAYIVTNTSNVTFYNSTINTNSAKAYYKGSAQGGAVYLYAKNTPVTFDGLRVESNEARLQGDYASGNGGAIAVYGSNSPVRIENSLFNYNRVSAYNSDHVAVSGGMLSVAGSHMNVTMQHSKTGDYSSNYYGTYFYGGYNGLQVSTNGGYGLYSSAKGGSIFIDGSNSTLTLDDTNLRYGYIVVKGKGGTGSGGAIFIGSSNNQTLVLKNNATVENHRLNAYSTASGGGVYVSASNAAITLDDSRISDNIVRSDYDDASGGGIAVTGTASTLTLKNYSEIDGNQVSAYYYGYGGGIHVTGNYSSIEVDRGAVVFNSVETDNFYGSTAYGGGIHVAGLGSAINLVDAFVSYNNATANNSTAAGGGISITGNNSTLSLNSAYGNGPLAAINPYYYTHGTKIQNNEAKGSTSLGGGVYISGGTSTIKLYAQSSINSNHAYADSTSKGGGVYIGGQYSSLDLLDKSAISGNSAKASNGNASGGGIAATGAYASVRVETGFRPGPSLAARPTNNGGVKDNTVSATSGGRGGGISMEGNYNSLTLEYDASLHHNSVQGNSTAAGGGISTTGDYSVVTLNNSSVADNHTNSDTGKTYGAGVYIAGAHSDLELDNALVGYNHGYSRDGTAFGGGISVGGSFNTVSLTNESSVSHNDIKNHLADDTATQAATGGGIFVGGSKNSVSLQNSSVSRNTADAWNIATGGGIGATAAVFNLSISQDSRIEYNTARAHGDAYGGGVASSGLDSYIKVSNNGWISNNTATADNLYGFGGGIHTTGQNTTIVVKDNAYVVDNKVQGKNRGFGGGVNIIGNNSVLNLSANGIVDNNNADSSNGKAYGGGVFMNSSQGSINLLDSDASISDNRTYSPSYNSRGGGVFISSQDSNLAVVNNYGHIDFNASYSYDGTVMGGGTFSTYNGKINALSGSTQNSNHAKTYYGRAFGGGAAAGYHGRFYARPGSELSDNNAIGYSRAAGGGVSATMPNGILVLQGSIHDNFATAYASGSIAYGGGVAVGAPPLLNAFVQGEIRNNGANGSSSYGGGIASDTSITLVESTIEGNSAANGGAIAIGAIAIGAGGTLTMSRSTLNTNYGGTASGILQAQGSSVVIDNSTIANHESAGIENSSSGTLTIRNSTLAGNDKGIFNNGATGTITLESTIVALNTTNDIDGAIANASNHNLIGNNAGLDVAFVNDGTNIIGTPGTPVDPVLGVLKDNGGLTKTMALLNGPAVDTGTNSQGFTVDQRGLSRNFPVLTDIGAVELHTTPPSIVSPLPNVTATEGDPPSAPLDLTTYFYDVETPANLTFSVYKNTNTSAVTASIDSSNKLTLTYPPDGYGTADITIECLDPDGGGVRSTFTVTVNPIADTPLVANATTNEDTQSAAIVITPAAVDGAEVAFFQITNITGGLLFKSDGTTPIANGAFITNAEGQAGVKFTPPAGIFGTGSFDVQGSLDGTVGTLGDAPATCTITIKPVADTPSVTNTTTLEDTQSTTGLVITRNASDGAEVTHFNITNIVGGFLFLNNGTTPVGSGAFITAAEGAAGLKFTPTANSDAPGHFDIQASVNNTPAGLGGSKITATITVTPVADPLTITSATTNINHQTTSGLVISLDGVDAGIITHIKITNIVGGTLFQNDGVTAIPAGSFITAAQGAAGLKFTPTLNSTANGSFDAQGSTSASDAGLSGPVATGSIKVTNAAPQIVSAATASPTTAGTGQTVAFAFSASDPDGNALTITWDFGDGSTGTGETTTHVYTSPGQYQVGATASDGFGGKVFSTVTVTVAAPAVGDGIDSDGDGFSDSFETAAGSNPFNAGSTPADATAGAPPQALTVTKMSIKLSFAKQGADSISVSGTLPVPDNFNVSGKKVVVNVGGVIKSFVLDSKGASPRGSDTFKLMVKQKKGVAAAQNAKFTAKFSKGTFADKLADEGLTGTADVKKSPKTVQVDVIFNQTAYRKLQPQSYSAKAGKTGATK
jgi:hypothetical protein